MGADSALALDDLDAAFREFRRSGDRSIRNWLVEQHLDIARREAIRFSGRGEPTDDLLQVARLGVLKAVERFDPDHGVPFGAFARPTVAGELRRHFRDATWSVHVPRRLKDVHAGLGKASAALAVKLGRNPTASELAGEIGESVEIVLEALELRSAYRPASFSVPLDGEGDANSVAPPAASIDDIDRRIDSMMVRQLLGELEPRRRAVVYLRFFGQLSQSEIAERLGISQVHVSRLLRSSIATLHQRVESTPEPSEVRHDRE